MNDRMAEAGAAEGIEFRFDRSRGGNTFDAHRLIHLGEAHGIQDTVEERLFRALLHRGEPIGDPEVLVPLSPWTPDCPRTRSATR